MLKMMINECFKIICYIRPTKSFLDLLGRHQLMNAQLTLVDVQPMFNVPM